MSDLKDNEIISTQGIQFLTAREEVLLSIQQERTADVKVETTQRLGIPRPPPLVSKRCEKASILTLSGSHRTGANGRHSINMNKFLIANCIDITSGTTIGSWPSFIATPKSQEPVFLTFTIQAQPVPGISDPPALDVNVEVFSWRIDGTPAPIIPFSWVAIARATVIIQLGG